MSEPLEKQLGNALVRAWSEAATPLLGSSSTLNLITQQEAAGTDIPAALEITPAFASVFAAPCSGALSGYLFCLFKKEDRQQVELFISKASGSDGPAGIITLVNETLTTTAAGLSEPTSFGAATHVDLSTVDPTTVPARLAAAVGDMLWLTTFTFTVGERLSSQMLVLYAPHGSVATLMSAESAAAATASGFGQTSRRRASREDPSRNIERLLDVELEVVVRFGLTQIPLRELVRIGVGSMIELNRQVDEPVELLVNNRSLARGTVVVVDGYYGVCITEIGPSEERRQSLTKA
ncbi:MAG TPA: FliM/FliN family flagellar motor switch protein [Blastocatellia bacterium]|nr:FliM/FliN family flagellar motor switch protein [Blastocatellia bacterium]